MGFPQLPFPPYIQRRGSDDHRPGQHLHQVSQHRRTRSAPAGTRARPLTRIEALWQHDKTRSSPCLRPLRTRGFILRSTRIDTILQEASLGRKAIFSETFCVLVWHQWLGLCSPPPSSSSSDFSDVLLDTTLITRRMACHQ